MVLFEKNLNIQFLKYLVVGVINTLFGYGIFSLLIYLNVHYVLALSIATCLGILFNFKTIGHIVFHNSDMRLLTKFILVYGVIYVINLLIVKMFTLYTVNLYLAGAVGTFVGVIVAFILNKKWVFTNN